jgi:hypothetical protein
MIMVFLPVLAALLTVAGLTRRRRPYRGSAHEFHYKKKFSREKVKTLVYRKVSGLTLSVRIRHASRYYRGNTKHV